VMPQSVEVLEGPRTANEPPRAVTSAVDGEPQTRPRTYQPALRAGVLRAGGVAGHARPGRGRIVNVSSGAGFAAVPMLSAYVVSKTALYRLSETSPPKPAGTA
jgi:NAD(P)-dependent dehydrogenase (short-subunit alcohol dehydrogenase family)